MLILKAILAAITTYAILTTALYMIIKKAEIKIVLKEKEKENENVK